MRVASYEPSRPPAGRWGGGGSTSGSLQLLSVEGSSLPLQVIYELEDWGWQTPVKTPGCVVPLSVGDAVHPQYCWAVVRPRCRRLLFRSLFTEREEGVTGQKGSSDSPLPKSEFAKLRCKQNHAAAAVTAARLSCLFGSGGLLSWKRTHWGGTVTATFAQRPGGLQ